MQTENDEVRRAVAARDARQGRTWVIPALVVVAVVGLGWWVWGSTRDQVSMTNPTIDAPRTAPVLPADRGLLPEVGVLPAPVTPPADTAVAQATATATGRINDYDPLRRTLTLENGDTYLLATTVPGAETLFPGQSVTLTYRVDNTQRIVQTITGIDGGAPAMPGAIAPMTPNATPITPGAAPLPINP